MTNILDNELVRKYFGYEDPIDDTYRVWMAHHVIQAMQQPIKKGEKYLFIDEDDSFVEKECTFEGQFGPRIHTWHLRLPDRFQDNKMENKCDCNTARCRHENMFLLNHPKPSPEKDEVEEKIKNLTAQYILANHLPNEWVQFKEELRDLVRLARK